MRQLVGRFSALFFASILLVSAVLGLGESAEASLRYSDVPRTHAAYESIEYLSSRGVIQGYPDGSFGLNDPLTRAAATKMAVHVTGLAGQTDAGDAPFLDVPAAHWSAPFVRTGAGFGIVRGFEDGTFRPDLALTRAELAALAVRATRQAQDRLPNLSLSDVQESDWYYAVAQLAVAAGMMDAPTGVFRPGDLATRAEAAQAFSRAMIFAPGALDRPLEPTLNPITDHVLMRLPGQAIYSPVSSPMSLPIGAMVRTSSSGEASIEFPDGSAILLDPNTDVQLVRSFGVDMLSGATVEDLEVSLVRGSMITAIAPRLDVDETVARTWREGAGDFAASRLATGPAATGSASGSNLPKKAAGLVLFSDPGSLEPGDKQGAELTIVLVDAAGEPVTATDGPVTLELLTDVGRVSNVSPVIPQGYQAVTVTIYPPDKEPADAKTRFTAVAGDLSTSLTISTSKTSWWQSLFTKKTRATVRMPWAVASVRGTIVRIAVSSEGNSISVLDGSAEFTSSTSESTQVSGGEFSAVTSPEAAPSPPSEMPPEERQQWTNRSQWVRDQVRKMTESAPPELRAVIQKQRETVDEQLPPNPPSTPEQPPQPPGPPVPPIPPVPENPVDADGPFPTAMLRSVTWVTGEAGPLLEVKGQFTVGTGFQRATLNGHALSAADANGFTVRVTPEPGVNRVIALTVRDVLGRQVARTANYTYAPASPVHSRVNLPGDGSGVLGVIGYPVEFELTLRDAANQRLGRGGDLVTVEPVPLDQFSGMDSPGEFTWGEVQAQVSYDQASDRYRITLMADESASAYLAIRVNGATFHTFLALFPFGDLSVSDSVMYLDYVGRSVAEGWQEYEVIFEPYDAMGNPIFNTGIPEGFALTASKGQLADLVDNGDYWSARLRLPNGQSRQFTLTAALGKDELSLSANYNSFTSEVTVEGATPVFSELFTSWAAFVGENVTIRVWLYDEDRQPFTGAQPRLRVVNAGEHEFVRTLQETEEGVYTYTFESPSQPDVYVIEVELHEEPFAMLMMGWWGHFVPANTYVQWGIEGPIYEGDEITVLIIAQDAQYQPVPMQLLDFTLSSPTLGEPEIDLSFGAAIVTYSAVPVGAHVIQVRLNDSLVVDQEITVLFREQQAPEVELNPAATIVTVLQAKQVGDSWAAFAGAQVVVQVELFDKAGSPHTGRSVWLYDGETRFYLTEQSGRGVYLYDIQLPSEPDWWRFSVWVDGAPVFERDYELQWFDQPATVMLSRVGGGVLFAGEDAELSIRVRDSASRPLPGQLVSIVIDASDALCNPYNNDGGDVWLVCSNLPAGEHTVRVKVNGDLLSNPVTLEVLPLADPDRSEGSVDGDDGAIADGEYQVTFTILAKDVLGNLILSANLHIELYVNGDYHGTFTNLSGGIHSYGFVTSTPGLHRFTAKVGSLTLKSWSITFGPSETGSSGDSGGAGASGEAGEDPEGPGDDPEA